MASAVLLLKGPSRVPARRPGGLLAADLGAGFLLGMGVWNHIIFLPWPLALLAYATVATGRAVARSGRIAWVVAGFVVAQVPHALHLLAGSPRTPEEVFYWPRLLGRLPGRLVDWIELYGRFLDGGLLFRSQVGQERLVSAARGSGFRGGDRLRGVAGVWPARAARPGAQPLGPLCAAFATCFLLTLVITLDNADRYFILPLWFAPVFIGVAIDRARARGLPRWLATAVVAALAAFGLVRTGVNYFATYLETGGRATSFMLGDMPETSAPAIRNDRL